MKPLKPRTILLLGPLGIFLAVSVPFASYEPTLRGLLKAILSGFLGAVLFGVPFFGTMAWTARWSERRPHNDPVLLDRRYRLAERYVSLAGTGALGYLVGCWSTFGALCEQSQFRSMFSVLCIVLAVLCGLVVLAGAVAKNCIVERLEALKTEIAEAKKVIGSAQPERP